MLGQSYHNYGLAIDYFITSDDGKNAIWTVDAKWKRVAAICKSLGLAWGGDWSSFKNNPHLDMTGGLTYSQLKAGTKPRLISKVNGTTPPATQVESEVIVKDTPAKDSRNQTIKSIQKTLNSRYNSKINVDGIWGHQTKAASPNVREGAKGNITYILQDALYLEGHNPHGIDGILGSGTEIAVKGISKGQGNTCRRYCR